MARWGDGGRYEGKDDDTRHPGDPVSWETKPKTLVTTRT